MAYLSLYRKWRPRTFDEIAGQLHITQTLKNAIERERIAHAYLFCGPRGTGKTSTARTLAKAINCASGPTPTPCNECDSCKSINDGSSIDVLELDAASNRGVEETRELLRKIPYSSTQGRKKVYIIDEVHMLTTESFNTLLKTLEEPPEHVIFVLATTEPHKVLPTILSRCQRFDFKRISTPDIESRLKNVALAEGIDIDDTALSLIAAHAQGALRDALGILDQLSSYSKERITAPDVVSLLGLTDTELLLKFTDILGSGDLAEGLLFAGDLIDKGFDVRQFIQDLLGHLRNLFLVQTVPGIRLNGVPDEFLEKYSEQASRIDSSSLMFFINTLNDVYNQSRWATDIRLLFEIALFKMVKSGDDASIEGILHRIERLESAVASGAALPAIAGSPSDGLKPARKKAAAPAAAQAAPGPAGEEGQPASPSANPPAGKEVDMETIKKIWPQALKIIKEKKRSRYNFFAAAKLSRVDGSGRLVLSLNASAKEFIGSPENLQLIQSSLRIAGGIDVPVICELDSDDAPRTVAVVDVSGSADSGGAHDKDLLPVDEYIKLVQDAFGAKIVEEVSINEIKKQGG